MSPASLPEGAPPLPPPGGYRRAGRVMGVPEPAASAAPAAPPPMPDAEEPTGEQAPAGEPAPAPASAAKRGLAGAKRWFPAQRRIPGGLGRVVAVVTLVFVLSQLVAMLAGATAAWSSVVSLLAQAGVIALALTALRVPAARKVAVAALTLSLFLNVWTIGAIGMLRAAAQRDYPGVDTFAQEHARGFPGRKGYDHADTADRQRDSRSHEEARDTIEGRLRLVREALSAETGVEWVEYAPPAITAVPNGHGGTSMFLRYTPSVWTTAHPPRTLAEKTALTEAFVRVMTAGDGYSSVRRPNVPEPGESAPQGGSEPWGSDDPAAQHTWETYAYRDGLSATLTLVDLEAPSADAGVRRSRERMAPLFREPVEGVILTSYADESLPKDAVEEFIRRMQDYPGF